MIEVDIPLPTRLVVTALALRPELPLVRIVRLVACRACGANFDTIDIAGMTTTTFGAAVCAVERELRRLVVIESHRWPRRFVVAGRALVSKCAFVLVVLTMTADTCGADPFVFLADMASRALRLLVGAKQWEVCLRVIEAHGLGPAVLIVTRSAVRS